MTPRVPHVVVVEPRIPCAALVPAALFAVAPRRVGAREVRDVERDALLFVREAFGIVDAVVLRQLEVDALGADRIRRGVARCEADRPIAVLALRQERDATLELLGRERR